jgi:hypothetical protein
MTRPIPMIDDFELTHVTWARHRTTQRVQTLPVLGLEGDVQQNLGRASHEIDLAGVVIGEEARDRLSDLQAKAGSGDEADFTADITSALELEKVVILGAEFLEQAGRPGQYQYRLSLRESPPLPEPAELSSFGGLDGFDVGFDTDILGDIADAAGDLQNAIDTVSGALDTLEALAGLGNLSFGNPLGPVQEESDALSGAGAGATDAATSLDSILRGDG